MVSVSRSAVDIVPLTFHRCGETTARSSANCHTDAVDERRVQKILATDQNASVKRIEAV
jgi:hypothetical protein